MTIHKIKWTANALAVAGALAVIAGLAYLKLTPRVYQAVARVKVTEWVQAKDLNTSTDLRSAEAEVSLLQSSNLLAEVCQNLALAQAWKLSAAEMVSELKQRLTINRSGDSKVIDIRMSGGSAEAKEQAVIVNEIAKVYVRERGGQHENLLDNNVAALKREWDAQNQKVAAAQAKVNALYIDISSARATNQVQYYDSDAYQAMLTKRLDLVAQSKSQSNELTKLKGLSQDELAQTLSLTQSNVVLNTRLIALSKAQANLSGVKLDHSADSKDVKDAAAQVEFNQREVDQTVGSVVRFKEANLAGVKAALAAVSLRIKHASTDVSQASAQDSSYQTAQEELTKVKADRDVLLQRIAGQETKDAIAPASVTVEVIDWAGFPSQPVSPNVRAAVGIMEGGGALFLAGVGVWGMSWLARKRAA